MSDEERNRWFLGTLDRVAASSADTGGGYSVIVRVARRGFSPPVHCHSREDTGFFVLDGHLSYRVGDQKGELRANQFAFAPRGVPHWFRVESEQARFIEILTPGGFEGFHAELSEPAPGFELPPEGYPVPTRDEMAAAADRYGTSLLPAFDDSE